MARKISKSRKRRLLVIGTASLVAFVFFCVNVFSYTIKIVTLTKEQNRLIAELNRLKESKEELDIELKKLQDDEYLANYAREKYLYTKDNEIVIKITEERDKYSNLISESEEVIEGNNKILNSRKAIVIVSVTGLIILVIIARKKS